MSKCGKKIKFRKKVYFFYIYLGCFYNGCQSYVLFLRFYVVGFRCNVLGSYLGKGEVQRLYFIFSFLLLFEIVVKRKNCEFECFYYKI